MTNKKLLEKLQEDMEMRGFSYHTKDSCSNLKIQ